MVDTGGKGVVPVRIGCLVHEVVAVAIVQVRQRLVLSQEGGGNRVDARCGNLIAGKRHARAGRIQRQGIVDDVLAVEVASA